jgi:glycosyltransferase involved in cell wall biosynthesis
MISVTILVKNGAKTLEKALQALERFEEIVLLDTGSTDSTLDIAKQFANVKVFQHPFIGFGPSHNYLSSLATHDWILSIDCDEVASNELVDEIFSLQLDNNCLWALSRHNYFRGKFIKGCGWYPDCPLRLYNRQVTQFSDAMVHESLVVGKLKTQTLKNPLYHYPYHSISDFIAKMQSYSTLFAEQYRGKKTSSIWKAIGHGFFAFFKSYFLKRGIFLGQEGFIISLYNGHTAYYKYLKLQELNENL